MLRNRPLLPARRHVSIFWSTTDNVTTGVNYHHVFAKKGKRRGRGNMCMTFCGVPFAVRTADAFYKMNNILSNASSANKINLQPVEEIASGTLKYCAYLRK